MASVPLEPDRRCRAALEESVSAFMNHRLDSLAEAPVFRGPPDRELVERLLVAPSQDGVDIEDLLGRIDVALDTGFDTASGRVGSCCRAAHWRTRPPS